MSSIPTWRLNALVGWYSAQSNSFFCPISRSGMWSLRSKRGHSGRNSQQSDKLRRYWACLLLEMARKRVMIRCDPKEWENSGLDCNRNCGWGQTKTIRLDFMMENIYAKISGYPNNLRIPWKRISRREGTGSRQINFRIRYQALNFWKRVTTSSHPNSTYSTRHAVELPKT